jgi:acetyltransferase-like isoleucine patch superfamily enzyme
MKPDETAAAGRWTGGELPPGVSLGPGTIVTGENPFQRLRNTEAHALSIGSSSTMDGVQFAIGPQGRVAVGEYCDFTNAVLLCELSLRIGSYVVIGWSATIADSDFHPLEPAERVADAIALSPAGAGRPRPPIDCCEVVIEDDVWIGPNATILKGVRIGAGTLVEPGALVTRDVPPRSRVLGNPARVIGRV